MMMVPVDVDEAVLPAVYTATLVRLLAREGHTEAALLEHSELSAAQLRENGNKVSFRQHRQVVRNALRLSDRRHLGLEFGRCFDVNALAAIGKIAASRKTLAEAIDALVSYFRAQMPLLHIEFYRGGGKAFVLMTEALDYDDIGEFMFESFISTADAVLAGLLSNCEPVVRAQCRRPAAADWSRHDKALRFPVSFGQQRDALEFYTGYLDLQLPAVAPITARAAQKLLFKLGARGDLAAQIRYLLLQNLGHFPGLEAAAAQLRMSPRTLRRKLQQINTTYQTILDETRQQLATRYLSRTQMSVQEIAGVLGYTDPSNFGRAFRKWTGRSPSDLRR